MIIDFLKDLLFAYLELYAIIVINHYFVLNFHCVLLLGGKVTAEEDLAKGALANEVYYLVTVDYLRDHVVNIKEEKIVCDAAEG